MHRFSCQLIDSQSGLASSSSACSRASTAFDIVSVWSNSATGRESYIGRSWVKALRNRVREDLVGQNNQKWTNILFAGSRCRVEVWRKSLTYGFQQLLTCELDCQVLHCLTMQSLSRLCWSLKWTTCNFKFIFTTDVLPHLCVDVESDLEICEAASLGIENQFKRRANHLVKMYFSKFKLLKIYII